MSAKPKPRAQSPVPVQPVQRAELAEPSPPPSGIVVHTRFRLEDIRRADFTPHSTAREVFKYSCPICLRYLSAMLITGCCQNYLCHFCIEDFKAKDSPIACPMCNCARLELSDVDPQAEVKRYSDTPFSTFGAAKSSHGKWISTLARVEEDLKLAQELEDNESPLADPCSAPSVAAHLAVTN